MTVPHYLDHILNGAMVLDRDFTVMFWNHWLEIQTGIKKSDITGRSIFDFFPDINKNMLKRRMNQIFVLNTPAFINADAEKNLLKIPIRKLSGSMYKNMLQNVVISVYDKEAGHALFMIYDQTSLMETRAALEDSAKKLEEQHILLQNTMDFQSNIIFVISRDKIINCNNNFLELFGYDITDRINGAEADLLSYVTPESADRYETFYDFIEASLHSGEINKMAVHSRTTGANAIYLFSARHMPENNGMIIVSMTDITFLENREKVLQDINMELSKKYDEKNSELKKLNRDLTRSTNQLQAAQKLANIGSLEYNFSDRSIYISSGFSSIFDNPEMIVSDISDLTFYFTEKYKGTFRETIDKAMDSMSDFSFYAEIKSNAGIDKALSIHGKFYGKSREDNRLLITIQDLTNIKLLEKQISDKEQLLTSIFDVADIGFVILDPQNRIYRINKEFEKMTGYSGNEVIGNNLDFLDITSHESEYEKYVHSEGSRISEIFLRHKNGSKVYAYTNISKYSLEQEAVFTVYAFTDITDRIEILSEQKEQEQLLIQQSKMAAMGEMIGVIAHQWKQPLNALSLILDNIKTAIEDQEEDIGGISKSVDTCLEQVYFMAGTIDDFKNFFKHDNQMLKFNAVDTITGIVRLMSPLFNKNGTKINIRSHLERSVYVYGIPNEFSHTVMNILSNSKDAINSVSTGDNKFKGSIIIDISEKDQGIMIRICDNGGGIPQPAMEHIFEPYFTTKGDKGTGIGMYLAKIIINKKMKGDISVENVDGGACIKIYLPLAQYVADAS